MVKINHQNQQSRHSKIVWTFIDKILAERVVGQFFWTQSWYSSLSICKSNQKWQEHFPMRQVGYSMILNNDQLLEGLLLQDGLSIVRNQYLPWANGILLGAAAVAAVGRTVMPGMNGALKGLGMGKPRPRDRANKRLAARASTFKGTSTPSKTLINHG